LSAFLEVSGNPFVPQHLTDSCKAFSDFLRTVDNEFASRFGGELFFNRDSGPDEEPEPDTSPGTESRMSSTDLPKELQTLFHLDPGPGSDTDPAVVADVCGHDRDRILVLLDTGTAWVSRLRETDDASADQWERIVGALRHALRTVVLPPTTGAPDTKPRPEQMGLFTNPEEQTLFDDPSS
jgi:hypothetical protein